MLKMTWVVMKNMIVVLLLLFGTVSFAKQNWQVLPDKINKSEKDTRGYQAIKLANDMIVLLVSDSKANKSLAAVTLPVGTMESPDQQLGLAHYLEHMVLMGSKRYPEPGAISEFLQKHGGNHNASTAPNLTVYYLEVENDALGAATDRLASALAEPLLDPKNADRERNAVNAELTMARARDEMRLWQVRSETLNPAHPNSRFSGGNLETLSDKPGSHLQTELKNFYYRYYSANLMKGILYGNQSLSQLAKIAAETLGRIPNRKVIVPEITVPAITDKEKGIIIHYVPAQPKKALQLEFSIANNLTEFRSKTDGYIGYLIGNRSHNTLADWLLKDGLAEEINVDVAPDVDSNNGIFSINVLLTDKGLENRDKIIAAIFSYIDLLKEKGIKNDYFNEMANVLKLSFQHNSIVRDMNYIQQLSNQMLNVPIAHVLDANYIADRFDPKAISSRLAELTPNNARIWFISPNEPHNKEAYFLNAPYQVDKINSQQYQRWAELKKTIHFSLPELNPYIANDFSLIKHSRTYQHPELVYEKGNVRIVYMPSQYFADEPKGGVALDLRNEQSNKTAKSQVSAALLEYLTTLKLSQLSYQASIAGMELVVSSNLGLQLKTSGYTQHLAELTTKMVKEFLTFTISADEVAQAKSWYREQLEVTNNLKAFELAMQPKQRLENVPYFEQGQRLKALETITANDILNYRQDTIENAALQAIVFGNLTQKQGIDIIKSIYHLLNNKGKNWWRGDIIVVDKQHKVNFQYQANSTDNALAEIFIPTGYDRYRGFVLSNILANILHPWFFEQLRTQEQLGYAVFAFNTNLGEQWGLGFLLQSNSKTPDYLNARYQNFYQLAFKKLNAMQKKDFELYKKAILTEMEQPPQTFYEEIDRFLPDFARNNFAFDSRAKIIKILKTVSQQDLLTFYNNAVLQPKGLAFVSQIIAKGVSKEGYAQLKDWITYPTASELQKILPIEVDAK
ncbi:MAG TPA: pitrilysin [Arsenophonus nasoniae]|uniref:pitrilysin n=1 Tax=Arsenophonus nasoniae TaxID=638 RepID=UPI0038797438